MGSEWCGMIANGCLAAEFGGTSVGKVAVEIAENIVL